MMPAKSGRHKKLLPYRGEMLTLDELVQLSPGVSRDRIIKRIGDGWSIEDAVDKPLDKRRGGNIAKDDTLPDIYADCKAAEQQRLRAVNTIAQQIITGSVHNFDLQILHPMRQYSFGGDDLVYIIEFSREDSPCIATLTARYGLNGPKSSLRRKYEVRGALIKEVRYE